MDLHLKLGCWLIIYVTILAPHPTLSFPLSTDYNKIIDPFIYCVYCFLLFFRWTTHNTHIITPKWHPQLLSCALSLSVRIYLPNVSVNYFTVSIEVMNLCHRIHHSGIHAVYSFIHLFLVLVICFDALSLSPAYYLRLFWDLFPYIQSSAYPLCFLLDFTHLHQAWLITYLTHNVVRACTHTHTHTHTHMHTFTRACTHACIHTHTCDTLKSLHRSKQIRITCFLQLSTDLSLFWNRPTTLSHNYDCMKLNMWYHRTRKNKTERNKSKVKLHAQISKTAL